MKSFNRPLVFLSIASASLSVTANTVNIYGLLDASVVYGSGSTGSLWTLGGGNNAASRLGFSGSEDLGSGLRANFQLEMGLNNDTGTGVPSNTNNQISGAGAAGALAFSRYSWMGLQSDEWGEVRLGRSFTPTFRSYVTYDPFFGGGIGVSQAALGGIAAYGNPGGVRSSNAIEYRSPIKFPISVQLMQALDQNFNRENGGLLRQSSFAVMRFHRIYRSCREIKND